jgi:general secretion pathway protein N
MKALLRGPYLFSALLAAGIVLALVAIGLETDWGRTGHSVPVVKRMAPAGVADAGLLPAFSLAPIDQVSPEAGERPLFVPTRRPAPVAAASQAGAMRKGQFLLQGTSITKDFGDVAMLKEVATNRTYIVRKGEQLNGITVDKVEPSGVLLKQGEETEDLGIKTQGSPKGGPLAQVPSGSIFPPPVRQSAPPVPATAVPKPPATAAAPATNTSPASQTARTTVPQPAVASQAQLTPEEILARRRAARSQQTQ